MKEKSLAGLFTKTFNNHWDNMVFSDYEGNNLKYSDVAATIMSLPAELMFCAVLLPLKYQVVLDKLTVILSAKWVATRR